MKRRGRQSNEYAKQRRLNVPVRNHSALAAYLFDLVAVVIQNDTGNDINPRVAALYVQKNGCYFGLQNVDPWDESRDAIRYNGPYPVVAHPPCQLWGKMAKVNYSRWGGDHNRPGNDGGTFKAALIAVRRFCGVLEHPAQSYAWAAHFIEKPYGLGWKRIPTGWVCEVWQSAYGHKANKATWLYYAGERPPFDLRWGRPKGTHQIGRQDQRGKLANKPTLSKLESNATPPAFRDDLIRLAAHATTYDGSLL